MKHSNEQMMLTFSTPNCCLSLKNVVGVRADQLLLKDLILSRISSSVEKRGKDSMIVGKEASDHHGGYQVNGSRPSHHRIVYLPNHDLDHDGHHQQREEKQENNSSDDQDQQEDQKTRAREQMVDEITNSLTLNWFLSLFHNALPFQV